MMNIDLCYNLSTFFVNNSILFNHFSLVKEFYLMRHKQNQVPNEFISLYSPMLKLKQFLQSNKNQLNDDIELIVHGLVMAHFSTFLICALSRHVNQNVDKQRNIRSLIELILNGNEFDILPEHVSVLSSHIDLIGKVLNTTSKIYLYIAIYEGYLDSEIYYQFHQDHGIYNFRHYYQVSDETIELMRQQHDYSISKINEIKSILNKVKV